MEKKKPKISIGLPVFNGENYIRDAIDSVLAQTYSDWELIISDNGSTDSTQAICQAYADQDARILYIRQPVNIGASRNFNHTVECSSGKYFKWLAHDDLISADFLEKTVVVMDQDEEVVLCSTHTMVVDEFGKHIDKFDIKMETDSHIEWQRYHDLLLVWHNCLDIFGLIRSDTLKRTPLIGNYSSGDSVLLARLGLMGRFYKIPEYLLINRWHKLQSNKVYSLNHHEYTRWFDPSKQGKIIFPQWEILKELYKMIRETTPRISARVMCYPSLVRWALRYRRPLFYDLAVAARQVLNRVARTK
jgi:glycosyltransferase involved in cell wall biosynthesis